MHLRIFEVRYLDMIGKCIADGSSFGVVPLLEGREVRTPEDRAVLANAGTLACIVESSAPMPGLLQIVCAGAHRFRLLSAQQGQFGLWTGEIDIPGRRCTARDPERTPARRQRTGRPDRGSATPRDAKGGDAYRPPVPPGRMRLGREPLGRNPRSWPPWSSRNCC